MTIEEAIEALSLLRIFDAPSLNEAVKMAVAALRYQADTSPNEPLTPEELREMDGEPVYLPCGECWVLVAFNGFAQVFRWSDGSSCSAAAWCNNVGPAYRRKPEEPVP